MGIFLDITRLILPWALFSLEGSKEGWGSFPTRKKGYWRFDICCKGSKLSFFHLSYLFEALDDPCMLYHLSKKKKKNAHINILSRSYSSVGTNNTAWLLFLYIHANYSSHICYFFHFVFFLVVLHHFPLRGHSQWQRCYFVA